MTTEQTHGSRLCPNNQAHLPAPEGKVERNQNDQ